MFYIHSQTLNKTEYHEKKNPRKGMVILFSFFSTI